MIKLIQQPIQSCHLQALSSAIFDTEVKESQRLRFQTVASEMSVYRDSVHWRLNITYLIAFVHICCQLRFVIG